MSTPEDLIELVAEVARNKGIASDRAEEDAISLALEGHFGRYDTYVIWVPEDDTLRLVSAFACPLGAARPAKIYELVNEINQQIWLGAFCFNKAGEHMLWRIGEAGEEMTSLKMENWLDTARIACDTYYPAAQLISYTDYSVQDALESILGNTYGRA